MSAPPNRSPLAVGMEWASRTSAIGLEFGLPVILGYFLDRKFGTRPAGVLVGMAIGFLVGFMHLLRIARDASKPT